jgi:hypothetical protein
VFCSTGHYANPSTSYSTNASEPITYFSEVFPEPDEGLHVTVDWDEFLRKSLPQGVCNGALGLSAAQAMEKQKEDEFRKEKNRLWRPVGGSIPMTTYPARLRRQHPLKQQHRPPEHLIITPSAPLTPAIRLSISAKFSRRGEGRAEVAARST